MSKEDNKKKNLAQSLTHINEKGEPAMIDVGAKIASNRVAIARSTVILGDIVLAALGASDAGAEIHTKKGPVFQTAIIAGTMAVKKTSDLIPFCHPLGVERCKFHIGFNEVKEVVIDCEVAVTGKTGVEMEALFGVSVAALTIYDMCKALSHHIVIKETRLLEKTGGKQDFKGQG